MKLFRDIAEVFYWVLIATIPLLLYYLAYEPDCALSQGCLFIDDREFLKEPLFIYVCILLLPLTLFKLCKKGWGFFSNK